MLSLSILDVDSLILFAYDASLRLLSNILNHSESIIFTYWQQAYFFIEHRYSSEKECHNILHCTHKLSSLDAHVPCKVIFLSSKFFQVGH